MIDRQVPNLKLHFFLDPEILIEFFSFIFIIPVLHVPFIFSYCWGRPIYFVHTTCISSGSTMVVALFQVLARQFRIRAAISGFLSWKRAIIFFFLYPFICHYTVPYAPLNFLVCYDNQSALRNLLIIMHVAMCLLL